MSLQTISDVAPRRVVTARPDTDAQSLAREMREENVGSVVIKTDAHPVGIVTDRDLTVEVLAEGRTGSETYARELMTASPATVRHDRGIAEAARTMDEHDVRRLPVVDGGDALVGIVSLDDIYRELVREHEHLADVIEAESPR